MRISIGTIILIIFIISSIIKAAAKNTKNNPYDKTGQQSKPSSASSSKNKKSRAFISPTRPADIMKGYLGDDDSSGIFSVRNKKSRDLAPPAKTLSDLEKEYMKDHDFGGTFSPDGKSFIPNPEIEDPKDSKAFYIIILGIVVFAVAAFVIFSLYTNIF